MRILISPAKKMRADGDALGWKDLPQMLSKAELLYDRLRAMSDEQLQALWKCNRRITDQNVERLRSLDPARPLAPAILAYEGIQYQYMAPGVFTMEQFDYIQEHLRILSGLYGVLRPFDGVIPYRLEMQAKLKVGQAKDLYEFWGGSLAENIFGETDCVVNLASKEYSICVAKYQKHGSRLITCVFGEDRGGKVVEKGTLCKMARGEMVRYMAERRITAPEDIPSFNRLGYRFSQEHSDQNTYTFLLEKDGKQELEGESVS